MRRFAAALVLLIGAQAFAQQAGPEQPKGTTPPAATPPAATPPAATPPAATPPATPPAGGPTRTAQPPGRPPPQPVPVKLRGRGEMTPEEKAEFEREMSEVEDIEKRWEDAAGQHLGRMKEILRREYGERIRLLNEKYKSGIDTAEKDFRARHLDAITQLKLFLSKYPNDAKWTPDAMFRLADLYLDEAKWEYDELQAQLEANPPPPEEVPDDDTYDPDAEIPYTGPNYQPSIDIWREIAERFPEYRQGDSVVYLLAYYYGEMRKTGESKQAYLGLVCRNKHDPLAPPPPLPDVNDPRLRLNMGTARTFVDPYDDCKPLKTTGQLGSADLVDEAWVRIGEAHFDTRGELNEAIAAYKKVTGNEKSKFFDIALYKLAWSYYRNNQFMEGIQAFDHLVVYSDKAEDAGGQKSDLRPESVRYIAISFADVWEANPAVLSDPVKSLERINQYYKGRTNERHVRDVYEELGDNIKIQAGATPAGVNVPAETKTAYTQAISAWRFTIDNWPLHQRNPIVHKKIIDAYAFIGDAEAAVNERRRFAELYTKGTPWFQANETNREAMDFAQRQGELALLDAARNVHRQAYLARKDWKDAPTPEKKIQYLKLYDAAAKLYRTYLSQYQTSSEVYAVTYDLAESLFFGEQFTEAVPHYKWVRDHRELGDKFRAAADSVVKSWEAAVEKAKTDKTLVEPPVPDATLIGTNPPPIAVPDIYRNLQAAYDEYVTVLPDETARVKLLAAAMISYRHLQLDEALGRFQAIMDKYCTDEEAVNAKDGMLAIYQARNENDKFRETNNRFISGNCGTSEARTLAAAQNLSNEYLAAEKAFNEKRFEEAGLAFYTVYKTSKGDYVNKAAALFNAGLAYGEAGKPKTAIAIYEEFVKNAQFRTTEFYVEAMFLTALAYQKSFDYDRAVDQFLEVVDLAADKNAKSRKDFDLKKARVDALYNAALLRDLDRRYFDNGKNDPGAATLYKRYAVAETIDRKKASEAYFKAAVVFEKGGDIREMKDTFATWRSKYANDAGELMPVLMVLSYYKTAKALEKSRDKKGAEDNYKAAIKAFDSSGAAPGSEASEYAAEAQFWLAEQYYKSNFEPYKVKWLGNIASSNTKKAQKAVQDTLAALVKVSSETTAGYSDAIRFQASWSLAVGVRLGDISFFAGQKLLDAPVPKDILKADEADPSAGYLDAYQTTLETLVRPQLNKAQELWQKAVDTAKANKVSNEWSKLAQQRLNAYIASDLFPVQRDEMIEKEVNP